MECTATRVIPGLDQPQDTTGPGISERLCYNIDAAGPKQGELVYRDDDGSISIRTPAFSRESSSDFCWKDNNTIVGVDDLSAAQFVTEFFWSGAKANQPAADPLLSKLVPVRIDISVGHNVVVFYGPQSQIWPRHAAENLTAQPAFYVAATLCRATRSSVTVELTCCTPTDCRNALCQITRPPSPTGNLHQRNAVPAPFA